MIKLKHIVSSTKAVAVVEKRVRICLRHDFALIDGGLIYDFDLRLSSRGSDFQIYANGGYTENIRDTDLLSSIANALMSPRSGVQRINVRGYSLEVQNSAAVQADEITQAVLDAAHRAGYMVEYTNRDAEHKDRRGL